MSTQHRSHQGAGRQSMKRTMADELMNMVDEHLAWTDTQQHRLSKQGSVGTLIVDYDGTGPPAIFYRKIVTEPLSRKVEIETAPEVLQASVKPRRSSKERHYQEPTRASQAKRVPCDRSPSQSKAQPQNDLAPPLLDKGKGKARAPQRYDSVHSNQPTGTSSARVRPLHPHRAPPQAQDNLCRTYDENTHGLAPSNYKSSRTSNYDVRPLSLPRSMSTTVQYHRDDADGLQVRYSASQNVVKGYDPATEYTYDYNGCVVHVHRDAERRHSGCSEYFEVPAEKWVADVPVLVKPSAPMKKALPNLPREAVPAKQHKVVEFVKRLLGKLDEMGIMGKFRQQRASARKSRGWVGEGYVT